MFPIMATVTPLFQRFAIFLVFAMPPTYQQSSSAGFALTKSVGSDFCKPPEGEEVAQVEAKTALQCLRRCSEAASCVSAAFSQRQGVCLLYDVPWGQNRCQPDSDWTLWNGRIKCQGSQVHTGRGCQCVSGYIDEHCDRLVEDCDEASQSGQYPQLGLEIHQDVLRVRPKLAPFDMAVKCTGVWTVIQRHYQDAPGNFNRTWEEYVHGFGNPKDYYWLGLKNMYFLSLSRNYNLKLSATPKQADSIRLVFANFSLLDDTQYVISLGPLQTNTPDMGILSDINGRRFSTFDNYSSVNAGDCALERGGGWWYGADGCGDYSINGNIDSNGSASDPSYIFFLQMNSLGVEHVALNLKRAN